MNSEALSQYWPVLLLGGLSILVLSAWVVKVWRRRRPTPAEIERQRRVWINSIGKMGDGTLVEVQQSVVSYSYHTRGVEYLATQDISALLALLPEDPWGMMGPVSVKYDPRNPANSIVISEAWSGLRKTPAKLEK
jgi:hypothetical protein